MVEGITCPHCGSSNIARVLFGLPSYSDEIQRQIDAGDVVLAGYHVPSFGGEPYLCHDCGLRFDQETAAHPSA